MEGMRRDKKANLMKLRIALGVIGRATGIWKAPQSRPPFGVEKKKILSVGGRRTGWWGL